MAGDGSRYFEGAAFGGDGAEAQRDIERAEHRGGLETRSPACYRRLRSSNAGIIIRRTDGNP